MRQETKGQHTAAEALLDLSFVEPPEVEQEEESQQEDRDVCSFRLKGSLRQGDCSASGDTFQESKMDLDSELQKLRTENVDLKQQLSHMKVTKESFEGNDKKVQYMTGLPSFMTLLTLFSVVDECETCLAYRLHVKESVENDDHDVDTCGECSTMY